MSSLTNAGFTLFIRLFLVNLLSLLVLLCLPGCYRPQVRTVSISVGKLAGPECFDAIKKSIVSELRPSANNRIQAIEADFDNHAVVVRFKAQHMAIKNIEHAVAKAGFSTFGPDGKLSTPAQADPPAGCL